MTENTTAKPMYLVPGEVSETQATEVATIIALNTSKKIGVHQAVRTIGTPIPPCEDVETFLRAIMAGKGLVMMLEPGSKHEIPDVFEDVPLVRRTDMEAQVAVRDAEMHLLEEVLAFYVKDEDRYLKEEGEAYGSIPTDVGIKARSAASRFHAREQAAKHERGEA